MGGYDLHPTSRNQAGTFRSVSYPTYTQKAPSVATRARYDPVTAGNTDGARPHSDEPLRREGALELLPRAPV
ncbi:hypothetical protein GCM10009733_080800 [Nonomuraea maheshkhaliensis]|uniref:Uncharacterized protein n=1 Tax=Nonomuraea maheshkhaliensis TaxID=419590 RepID=A0ABN2GHF6_9ACTN